MLKAYGRCFIVLFLVDALDSHLADKVDVENGD